MADFEYTAADMEAWLQENPWDRDYTHLVPDMFGFQVFVLHRRLADLKVDVLGAIDHDYRWLVDRLLKSKNRVKSWWWLKRLQWRHTRQDRRYRKDRRR